MAFTKHRQTKTLLVVTALATFLLAPVACGQRGLGDYYGVGQLAVKPPVVRLSGKLKEITNHPCENTTGPAVIGTHLILEKDKAQQLNIHLGPTRLVADAIKSLSVGDQLDVIAFRTERLPANQYVATTLILGEQVIRLRDRYLRPYWYGYGAGASAFTRGAPRMRPNAEYRMGYRPSAYAGYGRYWRRADPWTGYRGRGFGRRGGRGGYGRGSRCWRW